MRSFDLRSLRFDDRNEAWRQLPMEVDPFLFGGIEYAVPDGVVDLDLDAARVGDRVTLTGSFETVLQGPCERCLEPAEVPFQLSGTEVVLRGESESYDEDEKYVTRNYLEADRWIRDLIGADLPSQILCREDCQGLCPICGANLNEEPEHRH
jgi:uncharacterized protein